MGTVLSTTSGSPAACATAATPATSRTLPSGLPMLSANSARVRGPIAARQASRSSGSWTNVTAIPRSANVVESRVWVPPYRPADATTWSPARARLSSASEVAACPLPTATAAVPPSSAAIRSSTTAVVGLDSRV